MRPKLLVFAVIVASDGCGGAVAESPLTVQLGLTHDGTEKALRAHQFCLQLGSSEVAHTQRTQRYPRCERVQSEHGDAWVIARYDGDRLVELRRFERYGDDDHAIQRWNELVGARMKVSAASDEAAAQLKERGLIEPGTRMMKAFRAEPGTVVGVYLLTPSAPDNANVLEKISSVK